MPSLQYLPAWLLAEGNGGNGLSILLSQPWLPLFVIGVLFYFMLIRPERRKRADLEQMIGNLQKNDRVVTVGGIFGTVVNVQKGSEDVTLKVDESNNTRLRALAQLNLTRRFGRWRREERKGKRMTWYYTILVFLSVTVVPIAVGAQLAKALRMKDHGWKMSLILCSLAIAVGILISNMDFRSSWNPQDWSLDIKQGIDLAGGVILIYEVDEQATRRGEATTAEGDARADQPPEEPVNINALVQALTKRINPGGVEEVSIRPYGPRQVEIIVPKAGDAEIKQIKLKLSTAGYMKFMIVATQGQHGHLFSLADQPTQLNAKVVKDDDGKVVGEWVEVAKEEEGPGDYKVDLAPNNKVRERIPGRLEVLMAVDDLFQVEGKHLHSTRAGFDETLVPCVNFQMTARGASLFGGLTGSNLPTPAGDHSSLGIVLDEVLISAPRILSTITDQGRITGRFTQKEVDFLVGVLRAGKLPAVLLPNPISESNISPLLGSDTIRKGKFAISMSLVAVLVFMLVYYRFAGIVACLALATNLVLILALMILIGAAFTLPGLAGLVLTVGMSVDANVLIFERIREELKRGSALRMAVRNGFARATTTIVDANLTTLITALVLYAIGTDQIRGFAVTLILGILMSMFTAIFCSRVIFDIAERKRWLTRMNMMQLLTKTNIDFIGATKIAAVVSVILIVVGLTGVFARGKQIFDIDFLGGTSTQAVFAKSIPIEEVRGKTEDLADDVSVTQVNPEDREADTVYRVVTSLEFVEDLHDGIRDRFRGEDGKSLLVAHSMTFTAPTTVAPADGTEPQTPPAAEQPAATTLDNAPPSETTQPADAPELDATPPAQPEPEAQPEPATQPEPSDTSPSAPPADESGTSAPPASEPEAPDDGASTDADPPEVTSPPPAPEVQDDAGAAVGFRAGSLLALADTDLTRLAQAAAAAANNESDAANEQAAPVAEAEEPVEPAEPSAPAEAFPAAPGASDDAALPMLQYRGESTLKFDEKINAETLTAFILDAAKALEISPPDVELSNPQWNGTSSEGFREWALKITTDTQQTQAILAHVKTEFDAMPVWLSSSKVGGKVAGDMQSKAIAALLTSLLGIVGYIWIRFQRVVYGLAAVVALVHDVLITLGAIALSLWLSKALGFLMIEEFKISLPIVAAFLTIIGYSLNDTIVVFDRIREVRGKSPNLTAEMINTSINQTLSRTLLTSLTTMLVVLILYVMGGEGIHGFAYALLIGVLVGTYSSMFVASPFLLWMSGVTESKPRAKTGTAKATSS